MDADLFFGSEQATVERVARAIRTALEGNFPNNGTTDSFAGRAMNSTVTAWMDIAAKAAIQAIDTQKLHEDMRELVNIATKVESVLPITREFYAYWELKQLRDCLTRLAPYIGSGS